jgi:hypothetical protein
VGPRNVSEVLEKRKKHLTLVGIRKSDRPLRSIVTALAIISEPIYDKCGIHRFAWLLQGSELTFLLLA